MFEFQTCISGSGINFPPGAAWSVLPAHTEHLLIQEHSEACSYIIYSHKFYLLFISGSECIFWAVIGIYLVALM